MSNLERSYTKILSVLQQLNHKNLIHKQIRTPKLSDIEVVALVLTAEYLNIDSERELFRRLPEQLLGCIERSVYHRRKKRLFVYIESLRTQMVDRMIETENHFIIDSMPLEVCKMSRSKDQQSARRTLKHLPITGIAPHNKCIFMAISYMQCVQLQVCSNILT